MKKLVLFAAALSVTLTGPVWPQAPPTTASAAGQDAATDAEKNLARATVIEDPAFASPLLGTPNGLVVDLSEKDSVSRLQLTFPGSSANWGLSLAAPIDKDSGRAGILWPDGFSSDVNVGLEATWLQVSKVKKRASLKDLHEAKLKACRLFFDRLSQEEQAKIRTETLKDNQFKKGLPRLMQLTGDSEEELIIEKRCAFDTGDKYDLGDAMIRAARQNPVASFAEELRNSVIQSRTVWMPSVGAKVGTKDFDFVELDPMEESGVKDFSTREQPWSLRASLGVLWGDAVEGDRVVWLTYQRSSSFEDAKSAEICSPLDDSGLENCTEKPFGQPVEKDQELLIGEYRGFLGVRGFRAGFALRGLYDFETKKPGASADLHFLRDSEDALIGGFRVSWQEEGTTGSIFLKKGFDFGPTL